ncbi:hypothetical protein [Pseudocolwellia agarivorans]|uniref:hypothetical protein n=1 Tax=Pseudocolwellia agarivorans TaxID=1911682 RepID=UPI003F883F99
MNFTLIEMGSAVVAFMIVIGIISYIIGKKKSTTPVRAALLGTVFSVIPVLGIIYVFYLANKEDLVTSK